MLGTRGERRQLLLVALFALAGAAVAQTATLVWTVRITVPTPPGFMFQRNNAAGFGVSDNSGLSDQQQMDFNSQFADGSSNMTTAPPSTTAMPDGTVMNAEVIGFTDTGNGTMVVEFEVTTSGGDPLQDIIDSGTIEIPLPGNGMVTVNASDPNVPIETTPRDYDDNDVPLILGIIFGIIGAIILIAGGVYAYKYWKEHHEDEKERKIEEANSHQLEEVMPVENPTVVQTMDHSQGETKGTEEALPQQQEQAEQVQDPSCNDEKLEVVTSESSTDPQQQQQQEEVAEAVVAEDTDGQGEPDVSTTATTEDGPDSAKTSESISDERAKYLWNATANAVADPEPRGEVVDENDMGRVVQEAVKRNTAGTLATADDPEAQEPLATEKNPDDIADERAKYLWNATANAVSDPPPDGHVVEPHLADVAEEVIEKAH